MISNRGHVMEPVNEYRNECHELLLSLKGTVERLVALPAANVWNVYGGLDRLANAMGAILRHRLIQHQGLHSGGQADIWPFIRGLRWLRPMVRQSLDQLEREYAASPQQRSQQWLRQSLLDHNLSIQLTILVNSRQHLLQHYQVDAYLCQPDYFYALLSCLRAVEQNRPSLLADVNPEIIFRTVSKKRVSHSHSVSSSISVNSVASISRLSTMPESSSEADEMPPSLPSQGGPAAFGLYASCNSSMADLSTLDHLKAGYIEPLGDPLQNFYTTSTAEQQLWTATSTPTASSLERLDEAISPLMAVSPQFNSEGSRLPTSASAPASSSADSLATLGLVVTRDKTELPESSTPKTQQRDSVKRHAVVILDKDDTRDSSGYEHVALGRDDDRSDVASLCTDSGIESVARSVVQRSGNRNVEQQKQSPASVRAAVPGPTVTGRHRSHARSASDCGVPTAASKASVPRPLSRKLSVTYAEQSEQFMEISASQRSFQQPSEGQSLMSFLSSQDFHTCTDLDRENAHFSIAEALIAAIEQMIWNQTITPKCETDHDANCDSDEEIQQLKQRIRIRRSECLKEKAQKFPGFCEGGAEIDIKSGSSSYADSLQSFESLSEGSCSSSSEDIHDAEINDNDTSETRKKLAALKESGLSLSMASLYSDADLARSRTSLDRSLPLSQSMTESIVISGHSHVSADSIAISLLKKFSEKQLPKASELIWLVSAEDAPQELLPLPASYPVSPDDGENADVAGKQNRLRGNLDWAPPRAQIIFTIHPKLKQSEVLAKQNYRCAGCGSKVETGFVKRYRYCEYLGKYFCPCCHSKDRAYIPGRILRRWDFAKYAVSHFAFDLLRRIYDEPLFSIDPGTSSTASALYQKVRALQQTYDYRTQLHHLNAFIQTCTRPNRPCDALKNCPQHWFTDLNSIHLYTLHELVLVKKNEFTQVLKSLVNKCLDHINQCLLCQAKGFVCELCRKSDDIIYPFELARAKACSSCSTCFHKSCFAQVVKCPKCVRIEARKQLVEVDELCDDNEPPDDLKCQESSN